VTPSGEKSEEMPSLDLESIELGDKDSEVRNRSLSAMNCNYEAEVTVEAFDEDTRKNGGHRRYGVWAKQLKLKNKKPLVFNRL
jgi:hypothetical protein